MNNIHKYLRIAEEAARSSGEMLLSGFGKNKQISYKGRIDIVTDRDVESEQNIISKIKSAFPDHDIITEESHISLSGSDYRWIIDPLDGTVNYAHNYPFFSVSIGLEIKGKLAVGVVFNPCTGDFYHAVKGGGAFLKGNPIGVSANDEIDKCFVATGFPYDIRESEKNNLAYFNYIIKHARAVRRDGCASLDMCFCAAGIFDAFWEIKLSPWDSAAGTLIISEAGGKVTDFDGNPFSVYGKELLATNGIIHEQMINLIKIVNYSI